jgi:hypothetical protein
MGAQTSPAAPLKPRLLHRRGSHAARAYGPVHGRRPQGLSKGREQRAAGLRLRMSLACLHVPLPRAPTCSMRECKMHRRLSRVSSRSPKPS